VRFYFRERSSPVIEAETALVVTFAELREALAPLHLGRKSWVDALHDLWKLGAPSPDSRILMPKGYDERQRQPGNVEKRLVLPTPLAQWIVQVSAARGIPYTFAQAVHMLAGQADYGERRLHL
jgi:hypothetical protein